MMAKIKITLMKKITEMERIMAKTIRKKKIQIKIKIRIKIIIIRRIRIQMKMRIMVMEEIMEKIL